MDNLHDDVVDRAFKLDAMRRKIQSAGLQPRQKYSAPQTSNQEIGWYTNPLVQQNEKWMHGRKTNHITEYADSYLSLKKVNPFKVKQRN